MEKSTTTLSRVTIRKNRRIYLLYLLLILPVVFLFSGLVPGKRISSLNNFFNFLYLLGVFSWFFYLIFSKKEKISEVFLPLFFLINLTILSFQALFIEWAEYFNYAYVLVFLVAGMLLTAWRLLVFLASSLIILDAYFVLFRVFPSVEIAVVNLALVSISVISNLVFFRERAKRLEIESAYTRLEKEAQELTGISLGGVDNPVDLLSKKSLSQQTLREKKQQQEEILTTLGLVKRSIKPFSIIFFGYSKRKNFLFPWLWISDGEIDENVNYTPGYGLIGQIFNSENPVFLSEFFAPLKGIDYYKRKEEIKSFIGLRVVSDDNPIGVLVMDSKNVQDFHEEHAKLLELISYQIRFILENGEMRRQLLIELQRSRALYELNRLFSSTLDLQELGKMVLSLLSNLTHYDFAFIGVKESDNVKVIASEGEYRERVIDKELNLHDTIMGELFLHPEICRIRGSKQQKMPVVERGLFPERDFSSILCVPMPVRNEVIGIMVFFSRDKESFSLYERRILEMIGNQLALTIRNAQLYKEMEQLAIKDGLTGLYNRRYFEEFLDSTLKEVDRYGYEISIIMMDIDHFKKVNDTYGHQVGDLVLKEVANMIKEEIREVDFPARYGGEEFITVLKFAKEKEACRIAERIRKRVGREKIEYLPGEFLSVTLSCGVASTSSNLEKEVLVEKADEALYFSKENGRNRVTCFSKLKKR